MADMNSSLLRDLYILQNEDSAYGSTSSTVYPKTLLDQVIDQNTPDDKNLRTILEELRQEIKSGGLGNIIFPVTSVNGKQGEVVLNKYDIGLENVDNTRDAEKPLSNPQRESVQNMLKNFKPTVEIPELYEHLTDMNNPHAVTFAQLNADGELTQMIQDAISQHNETTDSHQDIRNLLNSIPSNIDSKVADVNAKLDRLSGAVNAHILDNKLAHPALFNTKEDKSNKVIDFETIDNYKYPTTKAVVNYIDQELLDFRHEINQDMDRILDIGVVNTRGDLPHADESTLHKAYFILDGETNHDEFAVCRLDANGYGWDISVMSTVSKFNPDQFVETSDGLSVNFDQLSQDVVESPKVLLKILGIINNAMKEHLQNYVTYEDFAAHESISALKILPGTQSGTIRYYLNDQEEMSEDVHVTNLDKLAYLDKITEEYIEENTIHPEHIMNRAIEHRHLGDQVVAAHNMRGHYMHLFGNFEDKGGMRVSEVPLSFLIDSVKDALVDWMDSSTMMDWFKDHIKELVRQEMHNYEGWADPAASIRVYMNNDGNLIEECDDGDSMPYMYISGDNLIMDDEEDMHTYQEMERCRYSLSADEIYLILYMDTIEVDPFADSDFYADIPERGYTVDGNQSGYVIATYSDTSFESDTEEWKPSVRVKCPYAGGDHCEKCGNRYQDLCPATIRVYSYDGTTHEDHIASEIMECGQVTNVGENDIEVTLTLDELHRPNSYDGMCEFVFDFDWNGDKDFEQKVKVKVDPNTIMLYDQDNAVVWPDKPRDDFASVTIEHEYCEKVDNCDHSCCTVTDDKMPHTVAHINDAVYAEGGDGKWYPGIMVRCPWATPDCKGCFKHGNPADCKVSFLQHKDGADKKFENIGASWCSLTGYGEIGVTSELTIEQLEEAKEAGSKVVTSMDCDWDENGTYKQTIDIEVDPNRIILTTADDKLVYPEEHSTKFASVAIEHDYCDKADDCEHTCCTVEGSGTKHVVAHINDAVFSSNNYVWHPGLDIRCPYASADGLTCTKYKDPSQCHAKGWAKTPTNSRQEVAIPENACKIGSFGYLYTIMDLTIEQLAIAKQNGNNVEFEFNIDWDEDDIYEQEIDIEIDPAKVTLNTNDGQKIWP